MVPVCAIVISMDDGSFGLSPCLFSWGIAQPSGPSAVIGHMEVTSEHTDHYELLLKVVDSSQAAGLFNEHVRGTPMGTMH